MEPTRLDSTSLDAPVRLSSAQRLDLLAQAVAAVITTGLIAMALVGPGLTLAPLATRPVPKLTMIVAERATTPAIVPIPLAPRVTPRRSAAAAPTAAVRVGAPQMVAARLVSAPRMEAVDSDSTPKVVADNATPKRERRALGRRVAEIFTGNGAYTVRPFPTVPTERQ